MTPAGISRPAAVVRAAAVVLLTSLAGCSSGPPPQSLPCPAVLTVKDATYLTKFNGASEDLTDTSFESKVDAIHSQCFYSENETKKAIRTDLKIQFLASRGPKNPDGMAKFQYFVAVTGSGGQLLNREVFDVEIPLTSDKPQNVTQDEIEPTIPLPQGQNGDYFRIYVGLILTEQELAFNRRNPRQ
jgi:hypothetical protein